jgi:predicted amidohydrolase
VTARPDSAAAAIPRGGARGLRIGLAQIAPTLGDVERNLALHRAAIAAARAQACDLLVFPELSLSGYFLRDMTPEVSLRPEGPEIGGLLAAAGDMDLVLGFAEVSPEWRYYNAALYAEAGRVAHVHRKVFLPTYGLFEEQRYFAAGERIAAFTTRRFGRVGLLVCEDLWHLSAVAILQADQIDTLVCIANSPARGVAGQRVATADVYERMARTYAALLGALVIVVNRVGFEDGLCFWGGSLVVGPDGDLLAAATQLDPALATAEFDPADWQRARLHTPLARDERLHLTIEELERARRERYS